MKEWVGFHLAKDDVWNFRALKSLIQLSKSEKTCRSTMAEERGIETLNSHEMTKPTAHLYGSDKGKQPTKPLRASSICIRAFDLP